MRTWQRFFIIVFIVVAFFLPYSAQAQNPTITVPDLTGLFPAQAAAELDRLGLVLGIEVYANWSPSLGIAPNSIQAQTPAIGVSAEAGYPVSVIVARTPNARLIYDGNDLTLVNQSSAPLDLSTLSFRIPGEPVVASFDANRWANVLNGGSCMQVWSVPRGTAKSLPECESIQRWQTSTNPATHFWTPRAELANFEVVDNGTVVGTCPIAVNETDIVNCELFVRPSAAIIDATRFVYFVYTSDRLAIINQSSEQWMPLTDLVVYNSNPNLPVVELPLVVTELPNFGAVMNSGDINNLAVHQCVLFMAGGIDPTPPEPCDIIGQLVMDPAITFWSVDFQVWSPSRHVRTDCPAAVADRLSLCIVPR